jgi:AcrR family transcriptional regulator
MKKVVALVASRATQKDRPAAARGSQRPGGRTERVRKAVLGAVLEKLRAGDGSFSFQDIAKASGVHVATIYARWPDRASLVMGAYEEHVRKLHLDFGGDWEADLHRMALQLREFLRDPVEITANKLLITAGDHAYREQMAKRFALVVNDLAQPLMDAQRAGMIRADADPILIVQILISEILTITMFTDMPLDDAFVARIVDHLIHGCRA